MGLIVQKYGGSSLAGVANLHSVARQIVSRVQAGDQLVVVVSAMGKTTDALVAQAEIVIENVGGGLIPELAVANYRKVRELDASRLDAMWYLGLAASQQGRDNEARELWQHLLELIPPDSEDARTLQARIESLGEVE